MQISNNFSSQKLNFEGKTAYTKLGNKYEKTSKSRKIGATIGALAGAAGLGGFALSDAKIISKGDNVKLGKVYEYVVGFCKDGAEKLPELLTKNKQVKNIADTVLKSKAGRIGVVAGAAALAIGACSLVCAGVGAISDGLINITRKHKADKV